MAVAEVPPIADEKVGQTLEERAQQEPEQAPLEGFRKALSDVAGGNPPEVSAIRMTGGKLSLSGEFDKGQTVELLVRVRVAEVHFVDKIDKHGNVVGTDRVHIAKMSGVRRTDA